jgi:microcystin-dependent protein
MVTSTYKGYILIATGDEVDTWGVVLNAQALERIDTNLGGLVSKSLTNVNVTLTADENRNLILRLSGTLSGDVLVTTTLQGVMIVENLCTGAFAVTYTNGAGSPITLPNETRSIVIADASNGARVAADDAPEFPAGTRMLFQQTAAPTGWTKDVTHNNKALRLVSGTVGTGGSVAFTTAFASQSVAGAVGNTALTIAQMPLHGHPFRTSNESSSTSKTNGGLMMDDGTNVNNPAYTGTPTATAGQQIGGTGGGEAHTHTFTGTAINLAVQYVDFIIAEKD